MSTPRPAADEVLVSHVPLPPDASAPGRARRALRDALEGLPHEEWMDAAELAVSEVVTNATLHAHTAVSMVLRLEAEQLRVEVRDLSPALPLQRHYGHQATTGRGMALVAAVTESCGVTREADGKTVWFVVPTRPAEVSEDDLLAAFDDAVWDLDEETPAAPDRQTLQVRLLGLPPNLWLAADQHHDTLLRELTLFLVAPPAGHGAAPARAADPLTADLQRVDLALADSGRHTVSGALLTAIEQCAADRSQELLTLPDGHPSPLPAAPTKLDLEMTLEHEHGPAMAALQDALDVAEHLAATGALLAFPGQPEVVALRDWVTEQVQAQLSGVEATPWPGTDHHRFESIRRRHEVVHSLGDDVEFVLTETRGVVAADEGNRIVAVSEVLATALGWRVPDLLGRRVVALIPPALREAHVAGFTRHLSTGQAHVLGTSLVLPVLKADGTQVQCEFLIEQVPAPAGRSLYLAWITPLDPVPTTSGVTDPAGS